MIASLGIDINPLALSPLSFSFPYYYLERTGDKVSGSVVNLSLEEGVSVARTVDNGSFLNWTFLFAFRTLSRHFVFTARGLRIGYLLLAHV